MLMRLWKEKIREYANVLTEELPNAVMFVGMNMKVTTFNGLSFSSRISSVFLKNPLIQEVETLKEWYISNKNEVDDLVSKVAYRNMSIVLKKPTPGDVIPIAAAMETLETTKTAWIAGKLKLIPGQERFWYMACKNCFRALRIGHEHEMPCNSCEEPDPICLKCHVGVTIADASATAYAEMYSPDMEILVPYTAAQLKEADEEGRSLIPELEACLENKHVVCYIKYFDKLVWGAVTRKYPLVKIYLYTDVFPDVEIVTEHEEPGNVAADKEIVDLTKDNEDNVQFFTPSTKVLIEEISASSQNIITDSIVPSGCKRLLAFDDTQTSTITVKVEPIEDDIQLQSMVQASSSVQSPVKKTKSKLKQS